MPKSSDKDTITVVKTVKPWKGKQSRGCFVYLPPRWEGLEVSISLLENRYDKMVVPVRGSARTTYASVKCEWEGKEVRVTLSEFDYEEKEKSFSRTQVKKVPETIFIDVDSKKD